MRILLLATREPTTGPQGLPVNKTAASAGVVPLARDPGWRLAVTGSEPFSWSLEDVVELSTAERRLPIACVEGWSASADWRGIPLIDVVRRAGGDEESRVRVVSLQPSGAYTSSTLFGPQLTAALLATHLNGERLNLDHGYPLRLIAPDRPGVLNTKWLARVEVT